MSSIVPPCDGTDTSGSHSPDTAIASNVTATSVALKLSCNGIPALMMEFGANVGTRVPIGDVDIVCFFCKGNQLEWLLRNWIVFNQRKGFDPINRALIHFFNADDIIPICVHDWVEVIVRDKLNANKTLCLFVC